jgi:hypothetical protein
MFSGLPPKGDIAGRCWHGGKASVARFERATAAAGEPSTMALKDIEPFMKADIAKWAEVVKRAGIKIE